MVIRQVISEWMMHESSTLAAAGELCLTHRGRPNQTIARWSNGIVLLEAGKLGRSIPTFCGWTTAARSTPRKCCDQTVQPHNIGTQTLINFGCLAGGIYTVYVRRAHLTTATAFASDEKLSTKGYCRWNKKRKQHHPHKFSAGNIDFPIGCFACNTSHEGNGTLCKFVVWN